MEGWDGGHHAPCMTGLSHPEAQACQAGVPSLTHTVACVGARQGGPWPALGRGLLAAVTVPTCPSRLWQKEDQQPSRWSTKVLLLSKAAGSNSPATISSLSAGLLNGELAQNQHRWLGETRRPSPAPVSGGWGGSRP